MVKELLIPLYERFRLLTGRYYLRSRRIGDNLPAQDLSRFEHRIYSQNGADGIIDMIFRVIGTTNKVCVEFGVGDGNVCNTRYLIEQQGWKGLRMDCMGSSPEIKLHKITAENVNSIFAQYEIPYKFDFLSIDVDGNDYWIWHALNYEPRVVCIEYNSHFFPPESKTIKYDPEFKHDGTDYFGATLSALVKLGKRKGYELIYCDSEGFNAYFVKSPLHIEFTRKTIKEIYMHTTRGKKRELTFGSEYMPNDIINKYEGYPHSDKEWIDI